LYPHLAKSLTEIKEVFQKSKKSSRNQRSLPEIKEVFQKSKKSSRNQRSLPEIKSACIFVREPRAATVETPPIAHYTYTKIH
jgi:hypothetical protein